jgi:glucose uptake protein GlcU
MGVVSDTVGEAMTSVRAVRRTVRDLVVGLLWVATVVAFVLGQPVLGLLIGVVAAWQLVAIARGRGGLFVDQRGADRPGKPQIKG